MYIFKMSDIDINWALTLSHPTAILENPEFTWCPFLGVFIGWLLLYFWLYNPKKPSTGPTCSFTSLEPYQIACFLWASSIWDRFPLRVYLRTTNENLFSGGRKLLVLLEIFHKKLYITTDSTALPMIKGIQRKEKEWGLGGGGKRAS